MPHQAFQENLKSFNELINTFNMPQTEQMAILAKRYIEQNLMIMNEIFNTSIHNLKNLQNAKTPNDIICTQAKFTNEISKKLTSATQQFLNASLGQISNYNEWLKAHCDLATD